LEKISVIIPCRNEEKYIKDCLDSVVNCDYPKELIEVFVVDGKSSDNTKQIILEYSQKFKFIKLLINEKKTVPHAMNLGIKNSTGDYIIRLDAHSEYPPFYFSKLVEWSKKLNADNVGALWVTDVKNKNKKTNSIKAVLSNKLGVGNSLFRIGINEVKEVDTVPFGCYKRNVFDKIGLYHPNLVRDQDIELNKRLKRNGGKVFLVPDVYSVYYARETFRGIAKNNFQTGLWNILTVYITKKIESLSLRHFIPMFFLLSILIPLLFSLFIPGIGYIALFIFVLYFISVSGVSFKLKNKENSFFLLIWSFIVLHFSYGFGSLIGLFRIDKLFLKDVQ